MSVCIILPTYNERNNIKSVIEDIFSVTPDAHVCVVDDNSPDGTAGIVKGIMDTNPQVSLIQRERKEGLGSAYTHAMRHLLETTNYTHFVTMDADGSHDPMYLREMLTKAKEHKLVIGSRYMRGGGIDRWELWRKCLSKGGNLYARVLTGLPVSDLTAGFMCIDRELLTRMDLGSISPRGYAFLMNFKNQAVRDCGTIPHEIPIVFKERRGGESKLSHHIVREGVMAPLKVAFKRFFGGQQ